MRAMASNDDETARVSVEAVRSPRPTFPDGDPISGVRPRDRSMWRDLFVLGVIVVGAIAMFIGIAILVERRLP